MAPRVPLPMQNGQSAQPATSRTVRTIRLTATILTAAAFVYTAANVLLYFSGRIPHHRVESSWFVSIILAVFLFLVHDLWRERLEADQTIRAWLGTALTFPAVALALYLPSLGVGFLSDDFVLLDRAMSADFGLRSGDEFVRPLLLVVWRTLVTVLPPSPVAFHALNIVLHGLNGALTYRVGAFLGLRQRSAIFAAVTFVGFPSNVEAVTWNAGLQDVLMVTAALSFVLSALNGKWTVAFVTLLLALLTKETAVCAPVIALMLAGFFRKPWRVAFSGLVVAAAYAVIRLSVLPAPAGFLSTPSRYMLKEMVSRVFSTLGTPWTSSELSTYPVLGVLSGWMMLGLLFTILTRENARRREVLPAVVSSALWILLSVAPIYAYFFVSSELQGSRYVYLPSVGWALMLAWLFEGLSAAARPLSHAAKVGAIIYIAVCCTWTVIHQQRWRDAAVLRDAVVERARAAIAEHRCGTATFESVPDSTGGAYVFRNGFREALKLNRVENSELTGGATCVFKWESGAFQFMGSP